jgi:hypothetical protein
MTDKSSTTAAHERILAAEKIRHRAQTTPDHCQGINRYDLTKADTIERVALQELTLPEIPDRGMGGEFSPPFSYGVVGQSLAVKDPTHVNLNASIERVRLADDCGVFDMGLDTAETIGAKDATEQMLAYQMAAAHRMAMKMMEKSLEQRDTIEMSRLANTAARLMDVYQKAMLTLNKVRSGGKQVVVVQHVQVKDGGQAVINGAVHTGDSAEGGNVQK